MKKILFLAFAAALTQACALPNQQAVSHKKSEPAALPARGGYKQIINGKQGDLFLLKNKGVSQVTITSLGARVVSLLVPDRNNKLTDVVLGFDSVNSYQKKINQYFGATVGRYGNRIAKGKFTLDGKAYQLDLNNGPNSLHGGKEGFFSKVWDAEMLSDQKLSLSYVSKDGEGGYPGNLSVKIVYTLTDDNSLDIDYTAVSDKNTIVNLTNHSFFNLEGAGNSTVNKHILTIFASYFTPIDSFSIPTGYLQKVTGTPFDFEKPTPIGERIEANDNQLKLTRGYDHNFVLDEKEGKHKAASVYAPSSGIEMQVFTTEPGVQFYSGNNLKASEQIGKGNKAYGPRSGFCLETQHFPDSPNKPDFPSTVIKAGEQYRSSTTYKFAVRNN